MTGKELELIIVSGLSGAGKTQAIRYLEDMGYFCIDNLPPSLVPTLVEEIEVKADITKVALVMDIRGGRFFDSMGRVLAWMDEKKLNYRILFLEAADEILLRRFKETRRGHPLSQEDIVEGILKERKMLAVLKRRANIILDTSDLSARQLKTQLKNLFFGGADELPVTLVSFGFKYGIPLEADLLVDVRFIPNPYYDLRLRPLSGFETPVKEFVLGNSLTQTFMKKYQDLLSFLIPHYKEEGKSHLVIAIGCTGGRHRSVALVNAFEDFLKTLGCRSFVKHRDILRTKDR